MQPSPRCVGSVVIRRSTLRPSTFTRDAPVLRHALLGDVHVAHDLHAADDAGDHALRHPRRLVEHAVDAEADAHLALAGLEVDVRSSLGHRLAEDRVDELDHRRVLGGLAQLGDLRLALLLVLLDRLRDGGLERVEAPDQGLDVLVGGDRDLAGEPGDHLHVVDRDHVGRVGHREQQRVAGRRSRPGPPCSGGRRWARAGSPRPCRRGRCSGRRGAGRSARPSPARAGPSRSPSARAAPSPASGRPPAPRRSRRRPVRGSCSRARRSRR